MYSSLYSFVTLWRNVVKVYFEKTR